MGTCREHTAIIYYKCYPICDKHWDAECNHKFKYKGFKSLREYLGMEPVKKPQGYEKYDESFFSIGMDIHIDVEMNVPVIEREWLELPFTPSSFGDEIDYLDYCVKWNGAKKEPLELFIEVGEEKVVLVRGLGSGVRFTSKSNIEKAIETTQDVLNSNGLDLFQEQLHKKFDKSNLWYVADDCGQILRDATNDM